MLFFQLLEQRDLPTHYIKRSSFEAMYSDSNSNSFVKLRNSVNLHLYGEVTPIKTQSLFFFIIKFTYKRKRHSLARVCFFGKMEHFGPIDVKPTDSDVVM